jgi:anti-sigma factor RsiW
VRADEKDEPAMTDHLSPTEQLVQRFLDQELSADERIQFIVALGRDSMLRERVLEMERLVLDASKLPRPALPDGFVAQVMQRTVPANARADARKGEGEGGRRSVTREGGGTWSRLVEGLWAPRALQWNLAGAVAAACLVLVAIGGGVTQALRWREASVAASTASPTVAATPPVVLVRLVVVQPGAKVVQAAGDFNGWNPLKTPLEQTADGAWTVTLPLEPGRYEYQFVVDGEQWISDPFATEQNDDGFGARNAVLDVRPPAEML